MIEKTNRLQKVAYENVQWWKRLIVCFPSSLALTHLNGIPKNALHWNSLINVQLI